MVNLFSSILPTMSVCFYSHFEAHFHKHIVPCSYSYYIANIVLSYVIPTFILCVVTYYSPLCTFPSLSIHICNILVWVVHTQFAMFTCVFGMVASFVLHSPSVESLSSLLELSYITSLESQIIIPSP